MGNHVQLFDSGERVRDLKRICQNVCFVKLKVEDVLFGSYGSGKENT